MTYVAGLDGCPYGWVCVLWQGPDGPAPQVSLIAEAGGVFDLAQAPRIIAFDMPIGLAERAGKGGRLCERETRKRLGARQSSVFSSPALAALGADTFAEAGRLNRAHSDPPRGVSKQSFHIFRKIRELDALMTPERQQYVRECHPELSFWAMNGQIPLHLPKKVKGAANAPGLELRRDLLEKAGFPFHALAPHTFKRKQASPDDVLDACACAWSAWRMLEGKEIRLPQTPDLNAQGLRMEISA